MKLPSKIISLLAICCLLISFISMLIPPKVNAVTAADWQAGNIIADGVFANKDGMTAAQIQQFLNSKVPACDTSGSLPINPGSSQTRAQWAAANGKQSPPYTCLKDYYEVPKTDPSAGVPANNYGGQAIPAGAASSAQLIWNAAQRYSINPKVLLTTIQKESAGPLTVDDWPFLSQYTYAMGAHCPDSGPGGAANCDSNYAGFSIQIMESARLFRYYLDNMNQPWWPYKKPGNNSILYQNAKPECGSSDVNIITMATAALYTYTPYQPNQAALNNMYGLGDACSAYGNRNFWRIFNDWFGSTLTEAPYAWNIVSQEAYADSTYTVKFSSVPTVAPGGKLYLRIKARNVGSQTWDPSFLRLGTSHPNDRTSVFKDSSWPTATRPTALTENSVAPGVVGTFDFTMSAPAAPGTYNEYFNLVAEARTWLIDYGLYYQVNVVNPVSPDLTARSGLASGDSIKPGEYLLSPDAQSTLALQKDGNLVLYTNFKAVWSTGTNGSTVNNFVMQTDGNLVLYDSGGRALWNSGTANRPGSSLALQTDGNLVEYTSTSSPVWSTATVHIPNLLSYVNTSVGNSTLSQGQRLETADRHYKLVLQKDGNLVLYSSTTGALWASYTVGKNVAYLAMQSDGNMVLYDQQDKPIWWSGTNGKGSSLLAMQTDGNLVLYDSGNHPTWNSQTAGRQ